MSHSPESPSMSTAPTLPPTPLHPESHTYSWTAREVHVIQEYATAHASALAQRVEELERLASDWAALSQDDGKAAREIDRLAREVERISAEMVAPADLLDEAMRLHDEAVGCAEKAAEHQMAYDRVNARRYTAELRDAESALRTFLAAHLRAQAAGDKPSPTAPNGKNRPTPAMLHAAQTRSELGAYACANLSGAYGLIDELWIVMSEAAGAAPPAQQWQAEWVRVPVADLEAASESLGAFLSDLGHGAADMQAMDNLDAHLAMHRAAAPQHQGGGK